MGLPAVPYDLYLFVRNVSRDAFLDVSGTQTTMSFDGADNKTDLSTRVNSARLADYVGKHVRLACKALQVSPYPFTHWILLMQHVLF